MGRRSRHALAVAGVLLLVPLAGIAQAGAPAGSENASDKRATPATPGGPGTPATPATPANEAPVIDVSNADRCDFLMPGQCLTPFPNDWFTVADASTATGRRVNLNRASMPANKNGVRIDPAGQNRSDGFSPGQGIVVHVPGLDTPEALAQTGAVPVTDLARTYDEDQPVVLIDAATGRRQLLFAELDMKATSAAERDLNVHPAVQLQSGHRYIVALRHLRNADGELLRASDAFRIYRDRLKSDQAVVEQRRPHMESLLDTLQNAGIKRKSLYLAWDFTVASTQNITERMLRIRDDAFAKLGDTNLADRTVQGASPAFTVTAVTNFAPCSAGASPGCEPGEDARWARRIRGTVTVPCYLTSPNCAPGGTFVTGPDGLPVQNGTSTTQAPFSCNIPQAYAAAPSGTLMRPTLYGHGLFGTYTQTEGSKRGDLANAGMLMMCGTEFKGMANDDQANVITQVLPDESKFDQMADRMQQGLLNFLYLGRAMINPGGFPAHPAFQFDKGSGPQPAIDTRRAFYTGVSEGGILGGSLTAVAPDWDNAALVVPGMNYSVLLPRSTDYAPFEAVLKSAYPDESDRTMVLQLIQMLWDRGEPSGYVHNLTDTPLPNTPPHKVLLSAGFGDHQVSNVTLETEARTLGAKRRIPTLDPGRSLDVTPFYGIDPIPGYPYAGSASMVMWDIGPLRPNGAGGWLGTEPAPITNMPPGPPNVDPHGFAGQEAQANAQIAAFLDHGGQVIDTCGDAPCYAGGWTGP